MSDYKMLAGLVAFVVIILATLGAASTRYPSLAPQSPGGWPPAAPSYSNPLDCAPGHWCAVPPQECVDNSNVFTQIASGIGCIARYIFYFFGFIAGGIIWIIAAAWFILSFMIGLMSFNLPGSAGNPIMGIISDVLKLAIIVVMALLVFRVARSVVPFVSGGDSS